MQENEKLRKKNGKMPEHLKEIKIADYTYDLPEERIARYPLERRDASRLLVYEDGRLRECAFSDVPLLLSPSATLVFNNTKVIHARIIFHKSTGAAIEVFCLEPASPAEYVSNFAAVGGCEWKCMVGNLKKWKDREIYAYYLWNGQQRQLRAVRLGESGGELLIRFEWDDDLAFSEILELCGRIPIPPYLNRESEENDAIRYQTVYSKQEGSVAAPTAGLHFSLQLLQDIREKGIHLEELTLHVGAGTFKPVKSNTIGEHEMHTEWIAVSRSLVEHIARNAGELIAVGTTSVRSLESLYWMGVKLLCGEEHFDFIEQWEVYHLPDHFSLNEAMSVLLQWFDTTGNLVLQARTTIIIVPGYRFRVISGLFTNFHQPQSTLLLLVAAAIGTDWKMMYQYALENGFRFLSYGDSSFLKLKNQYP